MLVLLLVLWPLMLFALGVYSYPILCKMNGSEGDKAILFMILFFWFALGEIMLLSLFWNP